MQHLLFVLISILLSSTIFADGDVVGKNIDKQRKPGDDFFKYANGNWIKQNPIPAAYSQWSIGNLVQEDVWTKLKTINENALLSTSNDDNTRKIRDFYFAAMDTLSIEKVKLNPLNKELLQINAIKTTNDLLKVITHLHQIGVPVAF
ncbi:MAG TPA: M13 family metallopeptidase N-terminal domain-containing protein, partial [Chitinophagales bacterium]|nr:M13 family metallopeptidase N-terminal domain-containing protein [Chitinophagales bacterium]